jgi:hypothetical protein
MARRTYGNIDPKIFGRVITEVINGAKSAVKYIDERTVVKATLYGKRSNLAEGLDVRVKCGPPNVVEEKFILDCKAAGEPFPVKKIQLKFVKVK